MSPGAGKTVARQALFILLAAIFYRQLDLPSPVVGAAVYAILGAAYVLAGSGSRRRALFLALAIAGIVAAVPVGLRLLRPFIQGHPVDAAILLWPYHVFLSLVWVVPAWTVEVIAGTGRRGRAVVPVVFVVAAVLLFSTEGELQTTLLSHPVWHLITVAVLLAILLAAGISDRPRESPRRRFSGYAAASAVVALLLLFVFGRYRTIAVAQRGGLMEPTLFRFDFSDYVSLESDIRLGSDLVLVYHEAEAPPDRLLRRFVLAGYDRATGFYQADLPADAIDASTPAASEFRRPVTQEYYYVNLAPGAHIAVNEPVRSVPLQVWDDASFVAARRVHSSALDIDAVARFADEPPDISRQTQAWRDLYLAGEIPQRIAALAEEVTAGVDGYGNRVFAIESYLLDHYRYSLSPGVASDGDQLNHFLFESRKGYCSYFAFAMALMARSLKIPARVAVGFFLEEGSELLNYYPIRENTAHAWVEVYFDGLGWVEFDPTSRVLASGEEYTAAGAFDPRRMAGLVEEIIGAGDVPEVAVASRETDRYTIDRLRRAARRWWLPALALLLFGAALFDALRPVLWKVLAPRRRAKLLYRRGESRLSRFGLRRRTGETIIAFADRVTPRTGASLVTCAELEQRARFDHRFAVEDVDTAARAWREVRSALCATSRMPRWAAHLVWVAPSVVLRRTATAVLVLTLLTHGSTGVPAQSVEEFEDRLWEALDAENYDGARKLLAEARSVHPGAPRFPLMEGDLYFDRELFALAERKYRDALALGADPIRTRYDLSRALARQNRDDEAARELEWINGRSDPDLDIVSDLAWLYFKLHRLDAAIDLLENATDALGRDRYLEMTLGTVRGAQWDYDGAASHYRWAIDDARRSGDSVFEAVAEYNLSILETVFYRFDEALAAADRSIAAADRSSGHLIRGELMEQRLDYGAALAEYRRADEIDTDTVLPDVSMAAVILEMGNVERARALLDHATSSANPAWLYNYGTDLERHTMRLLELTADLYAFSSFEARLRPGSGISERLTNAYRSARDAIFAWYHRGLYRTTALRVTRELALAGQELDAQWSYLTLFLDKGRIGRPYLERARTLETEIIPASAKDYALRQGQLEGDGAAIAAAYAAYGGAWYGYGRLEAAKALLRMKPYRRDPRVVAQAYSDNPALFIHAGLRMPVRLVVEGAVQRGRVRRAVRREGLVHSDDSPLTLTVSTTPAAIQWRLSLSGIDVAGGSLAGARDESERNRINRTAREIGDAVLRVPLPANDRPAVGQP